MSWALRASAWAFADIEGMDGLDAMWMLQDENFMIDYLIGFQHVHVPRGLGTKGEILLCSVPFLRL